MNRNAPLSARRRRFAGQALVALAVPRRSGDATATGRRELRALRNPALHAQWRAYVTLAAVMTMSSAASPRFFGSRLMCLRICTVRMGRPS